MGKPHRKPTHKFDMDGYSRNFAFTNYDLDFNYDTIKAMASYLIAGLETCPTTGRKHHQGYVEFKEAKSLSSVIKKLGRCHTEHAVFDGTHNTRYCGKESNIVQLHGRQSKQGERSDLREIQELLMSTSEKEISEGYFTQWCQYRKAFTEYKQIHEEKRNWEPEVIYIYGPSGTGKTRTAIEDGAIPIEYDGKFFGNYNGEDIVLFDDVDENTFANRKTLLNLLDRYPYNIRIMGGYRNWKPKKIYLTSNYSIDELFLNDEAVRRRITKIIHLEKK